MTQTLKKLHKKIQGLKGTDLILEIGKVSQLELQWILVKVELEKHKKRYKKGDNIGSITIERAQINVYKSRLRDIESKLKNTFLPNTMPGAEA